MSDSSSHSGGGGGGLTSRLGRGEGTSSTAQTTCGGENLTHKMDAMMQIMLRMEERQLTTESRCERLESKCNKLEHMLEIKTNSMKEHVDSKFDSLVRHHEYNSMIGRNQTWKYSVPVHSDEHWENNGYDEDVAEYLSERSNCLKRMSEKMRRGEFPHDLSDSRVGIDLDLNEGDPILDDDAMEIMSPHWIELTDALKQFTPAFGVLPDGCETYFYLENIQLDRYVPELLKDALMHKPFQTLSFVNKADVDDNEGMKIVDIMDIMKSNKHLRKLTIGNNRIQQDHMKKIFSAVCRGSIVELDLRNCFENGLGEEMMTYLVTNGGLAKLKRLGLGTNGITSSTITTLADFLATNPPLQELDLEDNLLVDNDAVALANALRSNTTLRLLQLSGNSIRDAGKESLRLVLYNVSSLNSLADSNHSCVADGVGFHSWNVYGFRKNGAWHEVPASFNRARKIYNLLSKRNNSMSTSNVQHFDGIDAKILPFMLNAVQTYASPVYPYDHFRSGYCRVEPLSIVYEVMRKWDKVFPLYTDRGNNGSIE